MKFNECSAEIDAAPERVWSVLTDAPNFPSWDTGLDRIEGKIAPGEKVMIYSKVSPGRAFPTTVSEFSAPNKMVWSGGMPLGLFKGVRTFTLAPKDGGTSFKMREEFTGPLVPMIWRSMPDLGPTFKQFALDLKKKAEASA